jgi:hypothetical protein
VRDVAKAVYRKSIDHGNTSKALGPLSGVGIEIDKDKQKALGALDAP